MRRPVLAFALTSAVMLPVTMTNAPALHASAAQDPQTTKQMEELIAKASTPADHEVLRQHFLGMATKYKADAEMHAVLAGSNPRDRGSHDYLARKARKAAGTATELAELHGRMAEQVPGSSQAAESHASLPMTDARYPDLLPAEQLRELVLTAKTPADHEKLAKHYAAEAARFNDDARLHAAMATAYRTGDQRGSLAAASRHCARLVDQASEAAKVARELSMRHEAMATGNTSH